jgi:hypothetical protein
LKDGIDVNIEDGWGRTALHWGFCKIRILKLNKNNIL